MPQSRFLTWARYFYVLGLVLATILIIPTTWFPLQLGKVALFALCLLLASILFILGGGARQLGAKGSRSVLWVALLPLIYLVCYFFSIDRSVGLLGFSIEGDTLLFTILLALTFFFGFALFRSRPTSRVLLWGVTGAIGLAVLFQFVIILFGTSAVPFAAFSDRSVNLVGKWNDLGLLAGLLAMLTVVWLEFTATSLRSRIIGGVALLLLGLLLALIQFSLVWALLLGFCLLFAVASFIAKRPAGTPLAWRTTPWLPVVVAIVSALFLLWGSLFNTGITNVFPVSSLEVRPSFSSTLDIIKSAHSNSVRRFLIGTGPNTFGEQWLTFKPAVVNQSQFWNLDFNVGFSTFITALGSVGVLGAAAWLIPLVLVLLGLVRAVRSPTLPSPEKFAAAVLSLGALYLWTTILFYVPSQNIILLAFALAGAAFGCSMRGISEESAQSRFGAVLSWLVALVAVVLLVWVGFATARRAVAESFTNQGTYDLGQNDIAGALSMAARAQGVEKTGDDLRLAADAGDAQLQAIAATQNPTAATQGQFTAQVQQTIPQAQAAVNLNPQDYRAYISLGNIYALLNSLGVQGAYQSAIQVFQAAGVHDPTNPEIPLLMARVEAQQNNTQAVTTDLSQSLTLKPDYTDAILFVVQLDVANNDIPHAIAAAQAAVESAPGVASIWFELGLLYYSENDTKDAVPVLQHALTIEPDYANAQYFLGLSQAAQGDTTDAIAQFQALQKSNPDNSEVQLILGNLEAGKPPFTGAQPPVTSTPQDRTTAPISQ